MPPSRQGPGQFDLAEEGLQLFQVIPCGTTAQAESKVFHAAHKAHLSLLSHCALPRLCATTLPLIAKPSHTLGLLPGTHFLSLLLFLQGSAQHHLLWEVFPDPQAGFLQPPELSL